MTESEQLTLAEAGMIVAAIAVSPLLPILWRLQNMKRIKTLTALTAAWAFGLWTGINWMGSLIDPKVTPLSGPPAWVGTAEDMAMYAVVLAAVCVAAWIAVDYRYNGADLE